MKRAILSILLVLIAISLTGCGEEDMTKGTVIIDNKIPEGTRTFEDTGDEICMEDGKPLILELSTTWCPHCNWIKETYSNVVNEYVSDGKIAAYQWELDINDDALTSEKETEITAKHKELYEKYNPKGSIPTFIFGCKYTRVGNGYETQGNLDAEEKEFREIIEELVASTNN